jgi:hypothetical protein
MKNIKRIIKEEINDFGWAKDIEPMEPQMEFLKDNFDNLQKVIKDGGVYYVDSGYSCIFSEENGNVLVNYNKIWSEKDFGLKTTEIQEIIKRWLGETYNLEGFTPNPVNSKIITLAGGVL